MVSAENKKAQYSKCTLLWDEGGGVTIFNFFPNSNDCDMVLILIIYGWYAGEILIEFCTYMADIYDWTSPHVTVR